LPSQAKLWMDDDNAKRHRAAIMCCPQGVS